MLITFRHHGKRDGMCGLLRLLLEDRTSFSSGKTPNRRGCAIYLLDRAACLLKPPRLTSASRPFSRPFTHLPVYYVLCAFPSRSNCICVLQTVYQVFLVLLQVGAIGLGAFLIFWAVRFHSQAVAVFVSQEFFVSLFAASGGRGHRLSHVPLHA